MNKISKLLTGAVLAFSNSVMAYIPDRCDWQDCGEMARGDSGGSEWGLIVLIIIGVIIYANSK